MAAQETGAEFFPRGNLVYDSHVTGLGGGGGGNNGEKGRNNRPAT